MDKKIIAGYEIEDTLGEGGMGVVYRARDTTLDRTLAIKIIRMGSLGPEGRERFLREARACSRINHPNIVTVYAAGEEKGQPYLAMELLEGKTLRQIIEEGPVPWEKALAWTCDILDALHRLHQEGIIHRDLKPDNIMVTSMGTVKLMDFGIARLTESATLTQEGAALGTAFYMSPEQVRGEKVDTRSDIFAMGCVLYQALTGVLPFPGEQPLSVMYRIQNESPKPLEEFSHKFPENLKEVLQRSLEKDAGNRFPDAGSFKDALMEILRNEGIPVGAAAVSGRRERFLLRFAVPTLILAVVVFAAFSFILREKGPERDRDLAIQHNELGQSKQDQGDIAGADEEYRLAILADPQYALPWNNLGVLAYRIRDLDEADSLFNKAISLDPDYAEAMLNLADVLWDKKNLARAEDLYRSAISADSNLTNAYNNFGALLLELDRVEEAGGALDKGLFKEPKHPFLLKNRGRVALRRGEDEDALDYWTRALDILPEDIEINRLLANWFEEHGKKSRAADHWRKVLQSDLAKDQEDASRALERLNSSQNF